MNWLPIPLSFLKYIAMLAIVVVTYFYAHHSGYTEATVKYELQAKADLVEALSKQKAQQEKNQLLQTALQEKQKQLTLSTLKQTKEIEEKYYIKKPSDFFGIAGISHVSCSS